MAHRNHPLHISILVLFSFLSTLITRVTVHLLFLAMQQGMCLSYVVNIGRNGNQCMHQTTGGIHTGVSFHAKVILITLFGVTHFWVTAFAFGLPAGN